MRGAWGQGGPTGGCDPGTGGSMDERITGMGTKRWWGPRLRGPVGHHEPQKRAGTGTEHPRVRGPSGDV